MLEVANLETRVRETLRDRIILGTLPPGENLVEARLSEDLGVSRTPVRAALSALERDGLVRSRPNYGWFVAPLDPREAEELYPIMYALEDLAMRLAGPRDRATLARMRELNARLKTATNPREAIGINEEWHRALIEGLKNQALQSLLDGIRARVQRYEYAWFRKSTGTAASHRFHERIQKALARKDVEAASAALREHWLSDLEFEPPA